MYAKANKNMYLYSCLLQRCHFPPSLAPVAVLLDVEAVDTLKIISSRLVTKWHKPYLSTGGYIKIIIDINLVWAAHLYIWGSRLPAHQISVQRPKWEDRVGLNLFR